MYMPSSENDLQHDCSLRASTERVSPRSLQDRTAGQGRGACRESSVVSMLRNFMVGFDFIKQSMSRIEDWPEKAKTKNRDTSS